MPLNSEAQAELKNALEEQRLKFIAKFGREPSPSDPIFFDLDEDETRERTSNALRAAGFGPEYIYAYEETGLLVTPDNQHMIAAIDVREFHDKVREYYELIDPSADPRLS